MRAVVGIASAVCVLSACGTARPSAYEARSGIQDPQASAGADHAGGMQAEQAERASPSDDTSGREDGPQEFRISDAKGSAKAAHGVKPSAIKGTQTEAALKFFVVDIDKGSIPGIVVVLSAPGTDKLYAPETDVEGYAELLVPIGRTYELTYLSLGRRDVAARLTVSDMPKQNLKLTMRYKRIDPPAPERHAGAPASDAEPRFVLDGVHFDSASAQIRQESYARLDGVVEYMTHKPQARIEIAGHTDNAGNPKTNKALSQKRAEACRDYLSQRGIAPGRIEAIGYGDERPIASNDTPAGREQNRRIEAKELRFE